MHCSFGEDNEIGFYIRSGYANGDAYYGTTNYNSLECRILLIDQSSPELSYKIGKHPSNCCLAKETEGLKLCEKTETFILDIKLRRCVSLS